MKKTAILISGMLLAAVGAYSQAVTTYAGTQTLVPGGYNGTPNNSPLTTEKFSIPAGICVDTNNRFWVTDQHNMMLFDGGTSRIRGGALADPNDPGSIGLDNASGTVSRFYTPEGVAVNRKTNEVYICDKDNNVIRKGSAFVNTSNVTLWSTVAGKKSFAGGYADGTYANAEFGSPSDIAVTSNGTIYVSDYNNDCIRKLSGGSVTTFAGKGGTSGFKDATGTSALFYAPQGIWLKDDNTLLVADRNNRVIRSINLTSGAVSTVVSGLSQPVDVVFVDGVYYIADSVCIKSWDGSKLSVYAGSATLSGYQDGNGTAARFGDLGLMTYRASDKSIYLCDRENNVIRRITVIQPPVPDFVANNTAPTVNQTIKLTNKSKFWTSLSWAITPMTYTLQAGSKLTDSVVFISFNNTGSYTVTLTATNSTGSVPKTISNYINVSSSTTTKPTADFSSNKTTTIVGDTVRFIDMSSYSPTTWEWTITPASHTYGGGTNNGSQNPKVVFTATGSYNVTLKATNVNGFGTTTKNAYIVIQVNSVNKMSGPVLMVYPNPAADQLHVQGMPAGTRYSLLGLDGRKSEIAVTGGIASLTHLNSGMYILHCTLPDGSLRSARFIKE
ncbi:MAG: hypothetical protein JNL57_09795 [Bacteroidetes bacterium]|nr:hypothetical protein [Bacteroidota bacterium]